LGAVAIPVVLVMLQLTSVVPRSVLILYPPVLILLMAGSRFTYRVWKEHRLYSPLAALGEPVLILGAGEAGARLAKELTHSRKWRIVGLLDDNPAKQGRLLRNISVLGPIAELPLWTRRFGVRTVILPCHPPPTVCAVGGRALRRGRRRSADGSLIRGPDQRPFAADDDSTRRAR
jgi:FlaA1/EpsC-like NDP-sugar epimerase